MTTQKSSIDELLLGVKTNTHPETPENQAIETEVKSEAPVEHYEEPQPESEMQQVEDIAEEKEQEIKLELDDYGNEKAPPRTYTEVEVIDKINEAIRERFARFERNNPSVTQAEKQQVQQATNAGFEYNADSQESWQHQLKSFVKQTMLEEHQEQSNRAQQHKEQMAHAEFEDKFTRSMGKFNDFRDVVGKQPISDTMLLATRSMQDPAAFLYAASKRAPQELERIAKMADPYSQIAEMGKLEERMKQSKATTKAPKPLSKVEADVPIAHKSYKKPDIDDLLRQSTAKKLAQQNQRRGR
jgi:hypothetical protein